MRLGKRAFLLAMVAPALAAAAPRRAPGGALVLRPKGPRVAYRLAAQPIASRLTFAGFHEAFSLPGDTTVHGVYPIADRELLVVGFDASALAGVTQKLVAMIGWDGRTLRILDVETLEFASSDNGTQSSLKARLTATPDRRALSFAVEASRAEHGKTARHESWTDLLTWREGAPLAAEDAGKSASSWQTRMNATHRRIVALLSPQRTTLTLDMLDPTGLLDPLSADTR